MWDEFIGNAAAVAELRQLLRAGHGRRTLVLAGPDGIGKTTLAWMFGRALNCLAPPAPDQWCGQCASCRRAVPVAELAALTESALAWREAEVKTNPREAAPLSVALHPAIRVYPPDGDFFSLPQARAVIHQCHLTPDEGATWTLILPELDQARWATQAALLKTLEEPPPRAALLALARNPQSLLPTVRSRALVVSLAPVSEAELSAALRQRSQPHPELAARLAQGRPGRALGLDLDAYRRTRQEALQLLRAASDAGVPDRLLQVIRQSETTRAGKEKFESLIEILYSVLQDILYLQSGFSDAVRNMDCMNELRSLAGAISSQGIIAAVEGLDRMQAGLRRNVFRPLALASWALELPPAAAARG